MKTGSMQRAGYDEISHILTGLVERFGWRPMTEEGGSHRRSCSCSVCIAVTWQ